MTPDDDDRRDERLGEMLEVPPLDDVTRRRLVRRALDEPSVSPARARRAWAVVAAAAVVVVGVFAAAVVLRDDGGDTTAADRDRTEKTNEPTAGAADEEAAAAPIPLGNLGEISDPVVLRDRLKGRAAAPPSPTELEAFACPTTSEQLGTSAPVTTFATGTYEGAPALVLVASKDGSDTAFVLDPATCTVLVEVPLV
jgi:hypothetical protein